MYLKSGRLPSPPLTFQALGRLRTGGRPASSARMAEAVPSCSTSKGVAQRRPGPSGRRRPTTSQATSVSSRWVRVRARRGQLAPDPDRDAERPGEAVHQRFPARRRRRRGWPAARPPGGAQSPPKSPAAGRRCSSSRSPCADDRAARAAGGRRAGRRRAGGSSRSRPARRASQSVATGQRSQRGTGFTQRVAPSSMSAWVQSPGRSGPQQRAGQRPAAASASPPPRPAPRRRRAATAPAPRCRPPPGPGCRRRCEATAPAVYGPKPGSAASASSEAGSPPWRARASRAARWSARARA